MCPPPPRRCCSSCCPPTVLASTAPTHAHRRPAALFLLPAPPANTVFNVSGTAGGAPKTQGDLCVAMSALHAAASSGRYNISQQNANSAFFNNVAANISSQGNFDPLANTSKFAFWGGFWRDERTMGLMNPAGLDFRPSARSPLRGAGVLPPPGLAGVTVNSTAGAAPDIGAYQYGGQRWVPGCTFSPDCKE